jgi:hypothetical protein
MVSRPKRCRRLWFARFLQVADHRLAAQTNENTAAAAAAGAEMSNSVLLEACF